MAYFSQCYKEDANGVDLQCKQEEGSYLYWLLSVPAALVRKQNNIAKR